MLNVVGEPHGWVCGWISHRVAKGLGCEHRQHAINGTNIYYPYYFLQEKTPRDVAFFTHYSNPPLWDQAVELADVCVAISRKTAGLLPAEKTVVLEIPPDEQFRKTPIVVGISGRDYRAFGSDRKRLDWVESIETIPGIEVRFTGGKLPWNEMPAWYRSIDYLLVLADNEGGPMGVVEAIASGKPVIAPDVGLAWDYPVIRYDGLNGLKAVLRKLVAPPDAWDIFIEKVRALC